MSNVRDFGAAGDGKTDDSEAIEHAIKQGGGRVEFPRGIYRISRTIEVDLDRFGPIGFDGENGAARVLMAGPGSAFRFVGSHEGTGDPNSVKPNIRDIQRLPTFTNIEIRGAHQDADGIELDGTMQSVFEGVLVTGVRHGIRLRRRNRNVLISHCHIYHNTGVGIFFDHVNLHQTIIASCHVSYNRQGGIRIEGSQIRNLQITGNDIEYNNYRAFGTEPEPTAEIYIDTTADDGVPGTSVAEVTIASNTIQATPSPGGANIRILGPGLENPQHPPGIWTISGNIIGNQENNVHLTACYGVVLTGNFIYSCQERNLLIEESRQIAIGSNTFRRHTPRLGTGVRLVNSSDCTVTGCQFQDEAESGQDSKASLLELVGCRRINVTGCQVLDGVPFGIDAERCSQVNVTGCTVTETRDKKVAHGSIRFLGPGASNLVASNIVGSSLFLDEAAGVVLKDNIIEGKGE